MLTLQLLPCPVVLPCAEAAVEKAWQDIDAQLQDCDPASPHVDEDPIWKVRWASFAPCVCVCVCVCVCACVCVHVCACVCVCVSFLFCCAFSPSTPKLHLGFFVHCLPCPPVCDAMRCDANPLQEVRVFVSSTFADMYAEREVLVRKVFPKLKVFCQERMLRLVSCDLRWGVPKESSAEVRGAARCGLRVCVCVCVCACVCEMLCAPFCCILFFLFFFFSTLHLPPFSLFNPHLPAASVCHRRLCSARACMRLTAARRRT